MTFWPLVVDSRLKVFLPPPISSKRTRTFKKSNLTIVRPKGIKHHVVEDTEARASSRG